MDYVHYIEEVLQRILYKQVLERKIKVSEKELEQEQEPKKENKIKKQRKRVDKSQVAIKIVATFLTLAMILPIVASTIFYLIGE